jgi:hypothetical protein
MYLQNSFDASFKCNKTEFDSIRSNQTHKNIEILKNFGFRESSRVSLYAHRSICASEANTSPIYSLDHKVNPFIIPTAKILFFLNNNPNFTILVRKGN